jgi:uncharacterized protein (DUF433 family)
MVRHARTRPPHVVATEPLPGCLRAQEGVHAIRGLALQGRDHVVRPCIRGHRIWVSLILGLLAEGAGVAEILDDHPGIEEADVRACIAYIGRLACGRFVDVG